ncbi:MAG TPA: GMC family oxidoreductase [Bryobacteraceae bacterium]|jgi:quinoprotein glucose dehydrogenase|nr:GMC family oxidoreductase [Bryobacteraceae bacterium]
MPRIECDVCIIGGGISAALLSQKLSELKPGLDVVVVEAGKRLFDVEQRMNYRRRAILYGENPWPGDWIPDQAAEGIVTRTMAVGGSAMHWQGHINRFSEEDLRLKSMYGLAVDWPLSWPELERYLCEADRRIGVSGGPSPHPEDKPSRPYPMAAMPLTYNLIEIRRWAERSGLPFYGVPRAVNTQAYGGRPECQRCGTCTMCPIGARYSPDFTYKQLLAAKKIRLHDQTLVRRLIPHDTGNTIVTAEAVRADKPNEKIEYSARVFVIASGYAWTPHLLLLSANNRFSNGLANSSGLVGRYMTGHKFMTALIEVDKKLYPGMNEPHPIISRQFFRCPADKPFVRYDIQIFEAASRPRLFGTNGDVLFGDNLLNDWRSRSRRGIARVRMYYDSHPSRDSRLTLNSEMRNRFGDPMPRIVHKLDEAAETREDATHQHIQNIYQQIASANDCKILSTNVANYQDHPSGGTRMGFNRQESVCDSYGLTHDHPNLYVVGAPTLPTGGCTNATITFSALTLRSAERLAQSL